MAASREGAPSSQTLEGPPERMIAEGEIFLTSSCGNSVRLDFRKNALLAYAAGYVLRVLRPEVYYKNGLLHSACADAPIPYRNSAPRG